MLIDRLTISAGTAVCAGVDLDDVSGDALVGDTAGSGRDS
jgi:hypothetical protein